MKTTITLLSIGVLALAAPARAQEYPNKPITVVSAQASGGASDTVVRAVQERLHVALGQPILLENRPGAGGNVGAAQVARAAPDGHTLLIGTDAIMTSNVHLYKNMPFDPVKDFAPITNAGINIIVLAVHADLPVKSVTELVAFAKANPGKVQFGTSGVASPHHLAGELLKLKTGIDIIHVPYRGGALSANDLAGGHIGTAFVSYSAVAPLIPTGTVRVLAVVEKARYGALPEIPTIGETIPGFEISSWLGFFAPSGTPAPIVARLHDEIVKILRIDQVRERLAAVGLAVVAGTPADLAETVRNGIAVRGELVKAAKIEPQ
jgi:tripartite-type tricarboxylate transporter receptor subunit TctC